jgi:hypothetical protein
VLSSLGGGGFTSRPASAEPCGASIRPTADHITALYGLPGGPGKAGRFPRFGLMFSFGLRGWRGRYL